MGWSFVMQFSFQKNVCVHSGDLLLRENVMAIRLVSVINGKNETKILCTLSLEGLATTLYNDYVLGHVRVARPLFYLALCLRFYYSIVVGVIKYHD